MKTKTSLLLVLVVWVGIARGQTIPTVRILPDDVVQASIQKVELGTNRVAVKWTYTEAGAKKILTFREAHLVRKVSARVGNAGVWADEMAYHPTPFSENYAKWKSTWLTNRTDKVLCVNEMDANAVFLGLKGK